MMKLKTNERIRNIEIYCLTEKGPEKVLLHDLIKNKYVLIVGVPGAFTPTCNDEHLPEYIKLKSYFYKKGIDKIFFISVNDPFVLSKWLEFNNAEDFGFISDYDQNFLDESGLMIDLSKIGLGKRLSRFAIALKDCMVVQIFAEKGAELSKSSANNVLSSL